MSYPEKKSRMPINKEQLRRIKGIDRQINRCKRVKSGQLASFFEVSTKTIGRDIEYMRNKFDAPIISDNNGYHYSSPFNIPLDLTITGEEIRKLKVAVETLNQFQHLDIFQDLSGLIKKIEHSVHFKLPEATSEFIHFEAVPHYEGTELIELFIRAMETQQAVSFDYQSFKNDVPTEHILHPYVIKEHTNRWYIIGFLPAHASITSFALDRIVKNENLKILEQYFTKKVDFDIDAFFRYTYGMAVHSEREVEVVTLSFSPLQAKYFESKPFHKYENISESSDEFVVKMQLIPNFELVRKLVSFGGGVKVLSPDSLRNEVVKYFEQALKLYI